MPNVSSFGAQTDNSTVQGTVTDRAMVIPDIPPQGLMSVGPRVTPHFVKPSLWSALTTYHFFDAVHDAAGASYVAIKPEVPAGTELTDEGYWFLWADPNSQFADLSELVKTYNGRITKNTSDISAEVTRATEAEKTKAPINHASEKTIYGIGNSTVYGHVKLADNDTPATSGPNDGVAVTPKMLNDDIAKVKGTALYIGNSYTDGVGSTNRSGLYARTKDLFNKSYKYAGSGSGFIDTSRSEGPNFKTLLQRAIDEAKIDNSTITHLIVIGAWGESRIIADGNVVKLKQGINDFCELAEKNFPNLTRMVYFYAESRVQNYIGSSSFGNEMAVHVNRGWLFSQTKMEYMGWGGFNILFNANCFSQDGYHPNDTGYDILASAFKAAFNGNLQYKTFNIVYTGVDWSQILNNLDADIKFTLTPDNITIKPIAFKFSNVTNITANKDVTIKTIAATDASSLPGSYRSNGSYNLATIPIIGNSCNLQLLIIARGNSDGTIDIRARLYSDTNNSTLKEQFLSEQKTLMLFDIESN